MSADIPAAEKLPSRVYELAYLISPTIGEDKIAESVSRIKALLEKHGAFVLSDEFPRFRQLSYTLVKPIGGKNEKYASAYFGWVKFETEGKKLEELEADLARESHIVRFLL